MAVFYICFTMLRVLFGLLSIYLLIIGNLLIAVIFLFISLGSELLDEKMKEIDIV